MTRPYTAVMIVPTGIGAAIGGYAGDALPAARAIASVVDTLITHPNVLNGAQLYWNLSNAYYVEGYGLDQFAAGNWGLQPVHCNRIGLLIDSGVDETLRWRHLQAAEAARATLGLELSPYVITEGPLGVELRVAASGATWGTIQHPDRLLRAAERLVEAGAEAIAIVVRFPDDDGEALQAYRQGRGVDPLAGAEAVISHLLVRHLRRPCAHAPALTPLPLDPCISPKSAAEEIGYTFLPCVLAGLSQAPQFFTGSPDAASKDVSWADQVDAVIIPATACGGSAILNLSQTSATLVTVEDNTTTLSVCASDLGLKTVNVASYLEAIGVLAADRAGVALEALGPSLTPLPFLSQSDSRSVSKGLG